MKVQPGDWSCLVCAFVVSSNSGLLLDTANTGQSELETPKVLHALLSIRRRQRYRRHDRCYYTSFSLQSSFILLRWHASPTAGCHALPTIAGSSRVAWRHGGCAAKNAAKWSSDWHARSGCRTLRLPPHALWSASLHAYAIYDYHAELPCARLHCRCCQSQHSRSGTPSHTFTYRFGILGILFRLLWHIFLY